MEQVYDFGVECWVQVVGGFIGEQQWWFVDYCSGDVYVLLFVVGQYDWVEFFFVQQVYFVQGGVYLFVDVGVGKVGDYQW